MQSHGEGEPQGEVIGRCLPLPPPFFFLFRRSNASLLWMTPITTFFFFSVIFGAMLASSTATRSEKSLTRAGRKVLVLSGALCPCRAGAGARQQQPRCLGTFDGARPFPALPTRDGERRSHRTALSHLPKLQPRVPQPQAGQTLQPLPRPPKGAHNTPFCSPKGEAVGIYVPLIKTPPPRAGGELPHSISCHGDHKSRKSKNTHL